MTNVLDLVEQVQSATTFKIADLPVDAMLRITTNDEHVISVVVIDPQQLQVILVCQTLSGFEQPTVWSIHGSDWGGSMLKMGHITATMRLRAHHQRLGWFHAWIASVELVDDAPGAALLRALLEASDTTPVLSEEEVAAQIHSADASLNQMLEASLIDQPSEIQDSVKARLAWMQSYMARACVVSLLSRAKEHGKVAEALAILDEKFQKDWAYQPPERCADPDATPKNAQIWGEIYTSLNLPTY